MPLLKEDKKKLAQGYIETMKGAKNIVLIKHSGIPANEINALRMWLADAEGNLQVVKKRVLLKGLEWNYDGVTLDDLDGSVALLLSSNEEDQHAPLKSVQKALKQWKKDKAEYSIEYVWGRYEWAEWKDGEYVTALANLPSKEELIGKFLFMLNHPVSSFARVLKAIADEQGGETEETPAAPVAEEAPAEQTKTEESWDAPKAEAKTDDAPETTEAPAEEAPDAPAATEEAAPEAPADEPAAE